MKTLAHAFAASILAVSALAPSSQAAFAASAKSANVQQSTSERDREAFVAVYGVPPQASDLRPALKSNGSNFPGAADLPDNTSLRLGSF